MFDTVAFIMKLEDGECDEEEVIEGFQALINSGLVWSLQGWYGRTAQRLIDAGVCFEPKTAYLKGLEAQLKRDGVSDA